MGTSLLFFWMLKSSTTVLIWCLSVCAVCSAERVDQVRHLDLRKDEDFRYINIQLQWVSAWLLLWLGVGIHLLLDIAKIAIMGARRGRWPQVAYAFACFYPVYYSFEMTFMYVNDGWYPLLPMQLYFTFTDSRLVLRCRRACVRRAAATKRDPDERGREGFSRRLQLLH